MGTITIPILQTWKLKYQAESTGSKSISYKEIGLGFEPLPRTAPAHVLNH